MPPAHSREPAESAPTLPAAERWAYGAGDFGINLYFISVMTYLLYFYTDVLGLTAAQAGGVLLVARLIDAVTDPLMGLAAERTRSRHGRLRPYLLYGALPLAVLSVLTFTVPDLGARGRLVWAYVTYIGFGLAYTVVALPYAALTASLTADTHERTRLSTVRMACAFAGGLAVSAGMPRLIRLFETPASAYALVMAGFAVAATFTLLWTFARTRERLQPPPRQQLPLDASLRAVFRNPPLAIVIVLFCASMLSFTIRQAAAVYYFQYNLGRGDLIELWFLVTLPIMFVGLLFVPALAARFEKAGAMMAGALLTLVGTVGLYFTPYDAMGWIFFWGCVIAIGGTPLAVLGWAMLPDTVDYAQWRHGVRADGAVFAFASFFQKLAKSLGGAGVAGALAMGGYVAHAEQGEPALAVIHALMTLAPAGIMLLVLAAAAGYRLSAARHRDILREITARL